MTKSGQVTSGGSQAENGLNRLYSVSEPSSAGIMGHSTPRIHSPLNDLPSRGQELIDFADTIFPTGFMDWQKFVAIHAHKVKPNGRWATPLNCVVVARQNGKSTLMLARILMGLFHWDEPLQIASAHRLSTSLEQFRQAINLIEGSDELTKMVKRVRWAHGSEEIETINGNRFIIKAGGAAARGVSRPETVHLDELREMHDLESFASLRYTLLAAKNPMVMAYTNAGDAHSKVLNGLKERGEAAMAGADDDIGYFEWSSPSDIPTMENIAHANPALGRTIHEENIQAVLKDPPEVVQTEVLCRWVQTISSVVGAEEWKNCIDDEADLDTERLTWLGLDLSPDRRHAALVGAQKLGDDSFVVKLLHTWENKVALDDKQVANDAAAYCRKYPIEFLLYSRRTSGAVAARLVPAGIPVYDMDTVYPQACDEMLSSINAGRLKHSGKQMELTTQILSAVRLPRGDGGWIIGRRASQAAVCGAVATALVTHFATRPETEIDILVG